MKITHDLKIDLVRLEIVPPVSVVQGDTYTREIKIVLHANGEPWTLPNGHDIVIRYSKPDGTIGIYDTLPDDSVAWSSEGNTVSVMLAPQMLTCPGKVSAQVSIIVGSSIISTFTFFVIVEVDPSKGAVRSENYNNWRKAFLPQTTGAKVGQYLQISKVDDAGRITEMAPAENPAGEATNKAYEALRIANDVAQEIKAYSPSGTRSIAEAAMRMASERLVAPKSASVGQYFRVASVDANGVVTAVEAVDAPSGGNGSGSGQNVNQMEPAVDDIPKVFFVGEAPTTKAQDELPLTMEYISNTKRIFSHCTLKVQGDSSAKYAKKNFNIKLFSDEARSEKQKVVFRDWLKTHKYCLKANWIDHTHARNVVNGRLWAQVVRSRADIADYPADYLASPHCGAVDGFPVKVYLNGVYQGIYTWNIRKDESMFNMDDETGTHAALVADGVNAVTAWRELPTIGGGDWTDELNDTVPDAVLAGFRNAYDFVMNSTDDEFKANIEQYFYKSSLIDYYIFIYRILMVGGLAKSQTMFTYDAVKYLANIYDMDTTWALYWTGASYYNVETACPEQYEHTAGYNLLYERLVKAFPDEIKARDAELRASVLSDANIINEFERFMDVIGNDLYAEDFASTTANGAFTAIPSTNTNNIQKLRDIIVKRGAYCDENIPLIGTGTEEIPATGITLSATTMTFTDSVTQTITATVEPSNSTDRVVWRSSAEDVATVANGVVRPISNGSATITATAGSASASCEVTVNAEELVVLTGISATYTGGEVTEGTALADLTGITVTASYSNGTALEVTDYTLSGTITIGQNTITVTYEGMTATFVVVGTEMDYGDALYPLVNGSNQSKTGYTAAEVTDGKHVKFANTYTESATGSYVNLLDITKSDFLMPNSINNQATVFSFHAGDVIKCVVSGDRVPSGNYGWRIANTSAGIDELILAAKSDGSYAIEATCSADYDIGAFFLYGTIKAQTTYEFDVSLIVNNQRYI